MCQHKITPNSFNQKEWVGDDGKTYKFVLSQPPTLTISLSHYECDVSCHYYSRVRSSTVLVHNVETGEEFYTNKYDCGIEREFNARRTLTKIERDLGGVTLGKIGDDTIRFNSPEEALLACIKMTADTFSGEWTVVFSGCNNYLSSKKFTIEEIILLEHKHVRND